MSTMRESYNSRRKARGAYNKFIERYNLSAPQKKQCSYYCESRIVSKCAVEGCSAHLFLEELTFEECKKNFHICPTIIIRGVPDHSCRARALSHGVSFTFVLDRPGPENMKSAIDDYLVKRGDNSKYAISGLTNEASITLRCLYPSCQSTISAVTSVDNKCKFVATWSNSHNHMSNRVEEKKIKVLLRKGLSAEDVYLRMFLDDKSRGVIEIPSDTSFKFSDIKRMEEVMRGHLNVDNVKIMELAKEMEASVCVTTEGIALQTMFMKRSCEHSRAGSCIHVYTAKYRRGKQSPTGSQLSVGSRAGEGGFYLTIVLVPLPGVLMPLLLLFHKKDDAETLSSLFRHSGLEISPSYVMTRHKRHLKVALREYFPESQQLLCHSQLRQLNTTKSAHKSKRFFNRDRSNEWVSDVLKSRTSSTVDHALESLQKCDNPKLHAFVTHVKLHPKEILLNHRHSGTPNTNDCIILFANWLKKEIYDNKTPECLNSACYQMMRLLDTKLFPKFMRSWESVGKLPRVVEARKLAKALAVESEDSTKVTFEEEVYFTLGKSPFCSCKRFAYHGYCEHAQFLLDQGKIDLKPHFPLVDARQLDEEKRLLTYLRIPRDHPACQKSPFKVGGRYHTPKDDDDSSIDEREFGSDFGDNETASSNDRTEASFSSDSMDDESASDGDSVVEKENFTAELVRQDTKPKACDPPKASVDLNRSFMVEKSPKKTPSATVISQPAANLTNISVTSLTQSSCTVATSSKRPSLLKIVPNQNYVSNGIFQPVKNLTREHVHSTMTAVSMSSNSWSEAPIVSTVSIIKRPRLSLILPKDQSVFPAVSAMLQKQGPLK